jgi:hypothetical protein
MPIFDRSSTPYPSCLSVGPRAEACRQSPTERRLVHDQQLFDSHASRLSLLVSNWLPIYLSRSRGLTFHEQRFTNSLSPLGYTGMHRMSLICSPFGLPSLTLSKFMAFLVLHLWGYDRFQCLKWDSGRQPGAFKRVMTYVLHPELW